MSRKLGGQRLKHRIRKARQELRRAGSLLMPGLALEARGDLKGTLAALEVELAMARLVAFAVHEMQDASFLSAFVDWQPAPTQTTSPLAARNLGEE